MLQIEIKSSFVELGNFLRQFSEDGNVKSASVLQNDLFFDDFASLIALSQSHNGWFTPEQVLHSIQSWAKALTEDNLNQWLSNYDFSKTEPKKVGLILAGNIPLVGFHDFLSVLISGHDVLVKTSSNDQHLLKFLARIIFFPPVELKDKLQSIIEDNLNITNMKNYYEIYDILNLNYSYNF